VATDMAQAGLNYPVSTVFTPQDSYNRLYAVPALGILIKEIMAIPHIVLLALVGIWVYICQLWLWIPVLFGGKYNDYGMKLNTGYLRWSLRLYAWVVGLTDKYPPFGFGGEHPVDFQIQVPEHSNRFWAIPAIGMGVKEIILIPHIVALYIMVFVLEVCHLVIWIPVLFTGKYPQWGRQLNAGVLAWSARVGAYFLGLTDKYPPFSMAA